MFFIRSIELQDNLHIAKIIREVSAEFELAANSGFAVGDPILDQLFENYQHKKSHYWILVNQHHQILGSGGIALLSGAFNIFEIQKMYFLPQLRGHGFAKQILEMAFKFARYHGIKTCYLEATSSLIQAIELYKKWALKNLMHHLVRLGIAMFVKSGWLKQ